MNVFVERSTIKDECATVMVLGIAKLTSMICKIIVTFLSEVLHGRLCT